MRDVPGMVRELQEKALPVSSHPDERQSERLSRAARRNAARGRPRFEGVCVIQLTRAMVRSGVHRRHNPPGGGPEWETSHTIDVGWRALVRLGDSGLRGVLSWPSE